MWCEIVSKAVVKLRIMGTVRSCEKVVLDILKYFAIMTNVIYCAGLMWWFKFTKELKKNVNIIHYKWIFLMWGQLDLILSYKMPLHVPKLTHNWITVGFVELQNFILYVERMNKKQPHNWYPIIIINVALFRYTSKSLISSSFWFQLESAYFYTIWSRTCAVNDWGPKMKETAVASGFKV